MERFLGMESIPDGRETLLDVDTGEVPGASIGINYDHEGFILPKGRLVSFKLCCFTLKTRMTQACGRLACDLTCNFQISHL